MIGTSENDPALTFGVTNCHKQMQELLLVESVREAFSTAWSNLQWWASVSFGLLALASFGRRQLILPAAIGLSVLYSLFTIFTLLNTVGMLSLAIGAIRELSALRESGNISAVGRGFLGSYERFGFLNGSIFYACFFATFLGTLTYLWYAYRVNARSR
jgi:hypothetical protein